MDEYSYYKATCSLLLALAVPALVIYTFKWLRPRFSVKVNCWFCHFDCFVDYNEQNTWNCPSCQQYNGFDESGNYNRIIESQYDSSFNLAHRYCDSIQYEEAENGLCNACNRNQVLKVKQLAQFEPRNQEGYDEEVDSYQQYLESVYHLCPPCEVVVQKRLAHLNRITRKNVIDWRQKRKSHFLQKQRLSGTSGFHKLILIFVLRLSAVIFGFLLTFWIICQHFKLRSRPQSSSSAFMQWITAVFFYFVDGNRLFISVTGFFTVIFAIFTAGKTKLQIIDAVLCFSWLLIVFTYLPILVELLTAVFIYEQVQLVLTCWATFISALVLFRSRSTYNHDNVSCKMSYPVSWVAKTENTGANESCMINSFKSNEGVDDWSQLQDNHITTTSHRARSTRPNEFNLNNHLSAMTISTPKKLEKLSGVFTKKSYGNCRMPFEFSTPLSPTGRGSILSPARLKSSSSFYSLWGSSGNLQLNHSYLYGKFSCGYYQPFGKTSSCPVSRSGSISGDDRLSIFSEPVMVKNPWNSFVKPEHTSFRRNSVTPQSSISSSSCASICDAVGEFQSNSSLKSSSLKNIYVKPTVKKERLLFIWCLFAFSLVGNAFLLMRLTNWKLPYALFELIFNFQI